MLNYGCIKMYQNITTTPMPPIPLYAGLDIVAYVVLIIVAIALLILVRHVLFYR